MRIDRWTRSAVGIGIAMAVLGASPAFSQQSGPSQPADLPSVFTSGDGIVPVEDAELKARGTGTAILRGGDGRAQFLGETSQSITRFGIRTPEKPPDPTAAANATSRF